MEIPAATDALPAGAPTETASSASRLSDLDREKVKQFARDFEALLMTQMLKEMRRSMLTDDDEEQQGFGMATMTDTIDSELGTALSKSGGLGIAQVLMRALDRQQGSASVAPGLPVLSSVPPVASGGAVEPSPVQLAQQQGPVTSTFGWRPDPINGQMRFHSGTDIRLAYGEEVRAAAAGRVVFAGEQSGYGETVVIDHGDGLETRYAHLSGYAVRSGDLVGPGQVVARSGNSGRTTGPHLHFEVLKGGRAIDPALMPLELAAKDFASVADFTANRSAQ